MYRSLQTHHTSTLTISNIAFSSMCMEKCVWFDKFMQSITVLAYHCQLKEILQLFFQLIDWVLWTIFFQRQVKIKSKAIIFWLISVDWSNYDGEMYQWNWNILSFLAPCIFIIISSQCFILYQNKNTNTSSCNSCSPLPSPSTEKLSLSFKYSSCSNLSCSSFLFLSSSSLRERNYSTV